MNRRSLFLKIAVAALSWAAVCQSSGATELSFNLILPPDIKWADLPQGPVLTTAAGMTIYKALPKNVGTWGNAARQTEVVGACVYQCPSEWPPVVAPADAKPVGDFTIIPGPGGVRQWAYKGIALETFIYDRKPGDTVGQDTYAFNGPRIPIGEAAWIESDIPAAKPPKPSAPSLDRPAGMRVEQGLGGNRYFTDASGNMLYTYDDPKSARCADSCLVQWAVVSAGEMDHAIGDWSVVAYDDGTRQWAYKGKPVYTSINDKTPGVPSADGLEGKWRAVIERQAPLPPEVTIRQTDSGVVYAEKATGKTLYIEGLNHRPYQTLSFNHPGILYGTVKCYNACAKTYPPLLAASDAKPIGEWWIVTRADGAKQWAFRGVPVYSYATDQPGRTLARNTQGRNWTEIPANLPPDSDDAS